MATKVKPPFGYLQYRLKLTEESKPGVPVEISVDSLSQADKIRNQRIQMNSSVVEHVGFRVVDATKKQVLWDYAKPADKQLRKLQKKGKKLPAKVHKKIKR